jgi:hypothetical protein
MTFNDHGAAMQQRIEELLDMPYDGDVKRDLALARTHLEDALTRFNSAQYRLLGIWNRRDPEKLA